MNMEISGNSAHRIEEAALRQDEMRRRTELKRCMAEIREEAEKCWGQGKQPGVEAQGKVVALWKRGMDILRKEGANIRMRKEDKNEHTVQEGSIGALRIVSAH
ncbi:MAG: hypothetical protein NC517_06360 [Firmicutes bacterium]|nr:hypothetical protein [Bacillota bacterium]